MELKTIHQGVAIGSAVQFDRIQRAFVWSVWLTMVLVALVCLAKYGWNVPLTEDWLLVPPLTGHQPNLANWLWTQNNEHRLPLPLLIMLVLLKVTNGDFRAGMLFNIITLSVLAFAMIRVARSLRGRTTFVDAFFPVALLHLGNWENLFWSWQIAFVVPMALICLMLLVLVSRRTLATPGAAIINGICLVLLPLSTVVGLLFVPFLGLWLGYCGVLHWSLVKTKDGRQWISGFLVGSAIVAVCLVGLYFVGYERPSWTPPNPGLVSSLWATLQFLALSFGPVARSSWILSVTAAVGIFLSSLVVAVLGVLHHKGWERHRALGIIMFFGGVSVLALAIGWGRAGAIEIFGGWPIRYALLAVPILYISFFAWELYGPPKLRIAVQTGLLLGMCLLIPFNTVHGLSWGEWYRKEMDKVSQDLAAGVPRSVLAERYNKFLLHIATPDELANLMSMLRKEGTGPFAQMKEDSVISKNLAPDEILLPTQSLVTQEIRYHLPEASEVFLVWGINGWQVVPEAIRPTGTEVKDKVMSTLMRQEGDTFIVKLQVPMGATINYGFWITKRRGGTEIKPLWDGAQDYRQIASKDGVVKVETEVMLVKDQSPVEVTTAPLVTQEIRYHLPEASEVFLVWGINGWQVVPEAIRPTGTEVKDKVMSTLMRQEGDTFIVKLQVPMGATINYGFWITKRRGILDVIGPIWDGSQDYQVIVSKSGVVEMKTTLSLRNELSDVLGIGPYLLAGVGTFLGTWLLIFCFLRLLDNR